MLLMISEVISRLVIWPNITGRYHREAPEEKGAFSFLKGQRWGVGPGERGVVGGAGWEPWSDVLDKRRIYFQ